MQQVSFGIWIDNNCVAFADDGFGNLIEIALDTIVAFYVYEIERGNCH